MNSSARRDSRRSAEKGFTLIELLVVIAIIGVLIALLLPAVQQAREAARRTECRNNMHQIGLALHNYHDAHNCLPPAAIANPEEAPGESLGHTWLTQILPFMDQMTYYNSYNFEVPYLGADGQNTTTLAQDLAMYCCPSSDMLGLKPGGFGATTYAGCVGYEQMLTFRTTSASGRSQAGIFNLHNGNLVGPVQFRDIRDGTSNTIVAGEVMVDIRGWGYGYFNAACQTGYVRTANAYPREDRANINIAYAPEARNDPVRDARRRGFSSRHEGIIMVLMADGSVRAVSQSIDYTAFGALATMAGNEQIDDEDF